MPIDDQAKSTLVTNVSNLVRHSHVKVDVQRMSLAFRMTIDNLEPGQPVELEPIFQYMVSDLAVPEKEALELCIVIASRKDKLGFAFTLPLKAQNLSTESVERIVEVHNDKRTITGSWDIKKVAEPEKEKKKGEPGWEPKKRGKKEAPGVSRTVKLGLALGISAIAAVAFNGWMSATAKPKMVPITVPSDGVPCTELLTNDEIATCTIPLSLWTSMPHETMKAKANLTKAALRASGSGVTTLWIRTADDHKIVLIQ